VRCIWCSHLCIHIYLILRIKWDSFPLLFSLHPCYICYVSIGCDQPKSSAHRKRTALLVWGICYMHKPFTMSYLFMWSLNVLNILNGWYDWGDLGWTLQSSHFWISLARQLLTREKRLCETLSRLYSVRVLVDLVVKRRDINGLMFSLFFSCKPWLGRRNWLNFQPLAFLGCWLSRWNRAW
jgi:hypothetical protein